MNQLYPIIRRVRRPLVPPEAEAGFVAAVPRSERSMAPLDATGQSPAALPSVAAPTSGTRADARRSKLKEKAE